MTSYTRPHNFCKTLATSLGVGLVLVSSLFVANAADNTAQSANGVAPTAGKTFPVYFKQLDPQTAFHSPEGYCTIVILSETKPQEVLREPVTSSRKLYARLFSAERPIVLGDNFPTPPTMASWGQPITVMRLTEREEGKGFDTAIIDLNNNGDLSDDYVWRDLKVSSYRKFFGPFTLNLPQGTLSANSVIKPVMYLESGFLSAPRSYLNPETGKFVDFVGFAAIRNGWALTGTIDENKILQQVAFKDAYCDFAFTQTVSHREVVNDDLYFDNARKVSSIEFFPSDYVLRDYNNNGRFDCELPLNEAEPFGKYLHLGEKLYTWQLSNDLTKCTLIPVGNTIPMGTYTVSKTANKRTCVALVDGYTAPSAASGTYYGDNQFQLITLDNNTRQVQLPAGNYILSQFALRSKDANNIWAHLPLDCFSPRESISFQLKENEEFTTPWGEPIKLVVDAYHPNDTSKGETVQIYLRVVGKNGENYSTFSLYSPKTKTLTAMAGPRIEIICDEKPVGSHTFSSDFLGWWWQVPAELKGKKVKIIPVFEECPVQPVPLELQL